MNAPIKPDFMRCIKRACALVVSFEFFILGIFLPLALFPTPTRTLVLLIIPCLWLARKWVDGRFFVRTPLDMSLITLLGMVLVSMYATSDFVYSLPKVTGVVYSIALFYAFVALTSRSEQSLWVGVFVLLSCGIGIATFSLIGTRWIVKIPVFRVIVDRLPRFLSLPGATDGFHPNQVAGTLLWVIPLSWVLVGLAWRGYKMLPIQTRWVYGERLFVYGAALFLGSILLLTQSRGAWAGVLTTAVFLLWFVNRFFRRWLTVIFAIGATILIGQLLYVGPNALGQQLFDLTVFLLNQTGGDELSGRLPLWEQALYGIQDFAFTGMGMNSFRRLVPILYPFVSLSPHLDVGEVGHAHNDWLQVALDLGVVGLIAYIALWVGSLLMLWQSWHHTQDVRWRRLALSFAACLLAYFIYGITDTVALGAKPGFIFWLLLGLIVSQHKVIMQKIYG